MNIGAELIAPNGFGALSANITYYLLANRSTCPTVLLACFLKQKSNWSAHFQSISRDKFEQGLLAGQILLSPIQPSLPPWLSHLEGRNLAVVELGRNSSKKSYQQYAEDRFAYISLLLDKADIIETAADPEKVFAQLCKKTQPHQNSTRLKLWFCAYQLFGRSIDALMPGFGKIGTWAREGHKSANNKLGRPYKRHGRLHGHSAIPLAKKIASSYNKRCGLGRSMKAIYIESMITDFGCKTIKENGNRRFYHPRAEPFPSYQQFNYWVKKSFNPDVISANKYGDARHRTKIASNVGSFSQACSNHYERCEADCYWLIERPRQILSSQADLPLVVARLICTITSQILGIGFAFGAENSEAYRAMLFSAAVPKSYFCGLFGIEIDDDEWPCAGIPPHEILDRGPGASVSEKKLGDKPDIIELAPSWSGQSKATVESSHPRNVCTQGQPTYRVSELNSFQLAHREVMRAMADNEWSDISSKLTPRMIEEGVHANPNAMARYLTKRGRTNAVSCSIEKAVRTYLTPINFQLRDDGLWYEQFSYSSAEFKSAIEKLKLKKGQSITLSGYIYPMVVRTMWVEVGSQLIEVTGMLKIRDDDEQFFMSLTDLQAVSKKLRELKANQREHAAATIADIEEQFYALTGVRWSASRLLAGSPQRKRKIQTDTPTVRRRRAS